MFSFKDGFKKARERTGLSQEKFAEKYNFSTPSIKKWEQGSAVPRADTLSLLCEIFDCDISYLFNQIEVPTHELQFIHDVTGLSEDAIYFLRALKEADSAQSGEILAAVNALLSEQDFDRCSSFWERLSLFLFSSNTPYRAQFGHQFRDLSAEDVLSILLSENEQYLRALRREKQNNG